MIDPRYKFHRHKTDVTLVNDTAKNQIETCPSGKRWILYGGKIYNGDDVARNCLVYLRDGDDVLVENYVVSTSVNAASYQYFPFYTTNTAQVLSAAYPRTILAGEDIVFTFSAGGASAGGTGHIMYHVYELSI